MRSRPLMTALSMALGGCVVVLPACPAPSSNPTDTGASTAATPAPSEATVPSPRPTEGPPPTPSTERTTAAAGGPRSGYAMTVLEDGPVAYWRFEEDAGVVALDASGRNRHGFYLDRPVLGDSVGAPGTGRAVSLQNEGDGVFVEHAPWTDMPNVTVEAWVRATRISTPEGMIVADKGYTWNLFIDPMGRPAFQLPGDSPPETLAPTPIVSGEDYHLAGTFEDGAMTLYVNGVAVSYGTATIGAIANNPAPIHVGRGLGAERFEFHGVIDDVALYDRALSSTAIARHYQAGR